MVGWRKRSAFWTGALWAVCSGLVLAGMIGCGGGDPTGGNGNGNGNGDGTRIVTGTVTDELGQPLQGVIVRVAAAPAVSTQTNVNGQFTLSRVPAGDQWLQFVEGGTVKEEVQVLANQTAVGQVTLAGDMPPGPPF
jgi:hypothetical protein